MCNSCASFNSHDLVNFKYSYRLKCSFKQNTLYQTMLTSASRSISKLCLETKNTEIQFPDFSFLYAPVLDEHYRQTT